MNRTALPKWLALSLVLIGLAVTTPAQDEVLRTAILPFSERGSGVKDMGSQVADLLFAHLAANPELWLVERDQMQKILDETELNLSGVVNPNQAIQIGQLSGARIIITGSVFKVKDATYLVAKIIGTETSRALGQTVNGPGGIDKLAEQLAAKVAQAIAQDGQTLLPKSSEKFDAIAELKQSLPAARPKLYIRVAERHVGQATIDPAAETELQRICGELGFPLTASEGEADVIITGEGFSEFSTRRGNLVSVTARVEIKAVDAKANILAVDRQTQVEVGLAEQITGKKALQEAAARIAARILPKVAK